MRILVLAIAGLLCGGCFVIDEIDQGRALMETHTPDSQKVKADPALADTSGTGASARAKLDAYYKQQRARASVATESDDPHAEVGACKVGSKTLFMRQADCAARGGRFL